MKEDNSFNGWMLFGCIIAIFSLFIPVFAYWYVQAHYEVVNRLEALGQIGDYLAGTTFLLALASILFVISSISIQKKELKLSRDELKESIMEQKKSNDTLKIQQFESSFFNLINLFNTLKSTDYEEEDSELDMHGNKKNHRINLMKFFLEKTNVRNDKIPDYIIAEYFNSDDDFDKLCRDYFSIMSLLNHNHQINGKYITNDDILRLVTGNKVEYLNIFSLDKIHLIRIIAKKENLLYQFFKKKQNEIISVCLNNSISSFKAKYPTSLNSVIETFKTIIDLIDYNVSLENKQIYLRILKTQLNSIDNKVFHRIILSYNDYSLREITSKHDEFRFFYTTPPDEDHIVPFY